MTDLTSVEFGGKIPNFLEKACNDPKLTVLVQTMYRVNKGNKGQGLFSENDTDISLLANVTSSLSEKYRYLALMVFGFKCGITCPIDSYTDSNHSSFVNHTHRDEKNGRYRLIMSNDSGDVVHIPSHHFTDWDQDGFERKDSPITRIGTAFSLRETHWSSYDHEYGIAAPTWTLEPHQLSSRYSEGFWFNCHRLFGQMIEWYMDDKEWAKLP